MSGGTRRQPRTAPRHLCAACRERRARFQYRGEVKADRQHVLCFQCFRSACERLRAWRMREGLGGRWLELPPTGAVPARPSAPLTERQIEHRRRMLSHMARLAASG